MNEWTRKEGSNTNQVNRGKDENCVESTGGSLVDLGSESKDGSGKNRIV